MLFAGYPNNLMHKVCNERSEESLFYVLCVVFFLSSDVLNSKGVWKRQTLTHTRQSSGWKQVCASALLQIGYAILTLQRNLLFWKIPTEKVCI